MKVLLDQCAPENLRSCLTGHIVVTAYEKTWDRLKDGNLLKEPEKAGFEVFVTPDKNLHKQQNMTGAKIAIVVLPYGNWPKLKPHVDRILEAVNQSQPGSFIQVERVA